MRSQQYPLVFLTTTFLVALTGSSGWAASFGFNDYQPQNITQVIPSSSYLFPDGSEVYVNLIEASVLAIPDESTEFMKTLKADPKFQVGWKFAPAPIERRLTGTFNIQQYIAGFLPISVTPQAPYGLAVGGTLKLNFINGQGDPPVTNRHWIQRIHTNYPLLTLKYGDEQSRIDIISSNNTPFYDLNSLSDGTDAVNFVDTSLRPVNKQQNIFWYAELYLAEGLANSESNETEVSINKGFKWGWTTTFKPPQFSKKFSSTLASGIQLDRFSVPGLTPGAKYRAWTNNDLPSNRCNPNTALSLFNDSRSRIAYDDNSSFVGNGFASGLTGIVPSSGILNLAVSAADGGARGQDRGNYELYVNVYDAESSPSSPDFSVATSGGGGFGKEKRGLTQQNPILPNSIQNGWQVFNKVPGCRWFDPPTTYGFEFQSLEDTLFTEILDFPAGDDQEFTVAVGDSILGNFSPGDKLDFVSLLGYPVDNFRITGIDSLFGPTAETAFPIQLAFQEREGSFKMRQISKPIDAEPVPEPGSILATKGMLLWFAAMRHILRKKRQAR